MTQEQYERWKDFARRMVNVAVSSRKRSPSRADVLGNIDFFFECRMDPNEEWSRVRDWDHTEKKADARDRSGPMCPGDHISDLTEHFIPNYWSLSDSESQYEKAYERFVSPVACCVRAGLDVACAPSAGVIGFTVGDIRSMYPEGVPAWIAAFFEGNFADFKDKEPVCL